MADVNHYVQVENSLYRNVTGIVEEKEVKISN
jgi:hypothetical protein